MTDQQNESSVSSSPEEKMFHYHQDGIDVKSLYLATKLADVHFVFESDDGTVKRIPAHKNLLAVTSDVFDKMFCGGLKENGDVKIVDASEAAFKEFLQFFYLNEVKLSARHVASVLYLGNKYNVEKCVDACGKCLANDSSNENVCIALSLAIYFELKELTGFCEHQILLNTGDIFKSVGFSECSKEVLAHILKMNQLSCSEVDVFEACMEWVRAKSQQQMLSKAMIEEHLGELYYQIRFASMTPQEFCNLETKYNAVLSSDFKAIIRLIERVDAHSEHFNTSLRQLKWCDDDDAIIEFNREDGESNLVRSDLDNEEKTTFSTEVPLVLGQFVCNTISVGKIDRKELRSDLSVEVKVTEARTLDEADEKVLYTMTAEVGIDYRTVSLSRPIFIRPNWFYTICIKGFPQDHCFCSYHVQKTFVTHESDIKIEFYHDKIVDGEIAGLIWMLKFNKI